jgi:hypothetical protein
MSENVCATIAPFCGLLPLAVSSSALMLLLLTFVRSNASVTSAGRLNCESVGLAVSRGHGWGPGRHTKSACSVT